MMMIPPVLLSTALLASAVFAQIPEPYTTGFDSAAISLEVTYGANEVTDGEKLGLDAVRSPPTLALGDSSSLDTNSRYIVIMIDPDAPSRANPTSANVLHWVKTDLRIRPTTATNITADNATAPLSYAPPSPPSGSGEHRYVFLLYDQPSGFALQGLPEKRGGFNVSAWRELNGLAPAKAGTYFLAEFGANSPSPTARRSSLSATESSGSGDGDGGDSTEDGNGASEMGESGNRSGSGAHNAAARNAAGRVAASGYGTIMLCWVSAGVLGGFFMGM
ncbi:PEBP-like protein [Choiromyces venosus 120613-1]|uniref:PEBP-like protein n=1 Tax=Choiromyces venosus 120613-1 TaxID=1336337 RepID=A0A3N4JGC2_9PEZI|nr:PEBP-like protein [Choiromyces venosus 120613-1]